MRGQSFVPLLLGVAIGCCVMTCGAKKKERLMATMSVTSHFKNGDRLPVDHTCEGKNVSPQLSWGGVPTGGKSFSIICEDPDAPSGIWLHWVVFNIPATEDSIAEGVSAQPVLPNGARQGVNDFNKIGYGGACPPKGHGPHRYVFKVYALDCLLTLEAGATKADLEKAMKGHVLGMGQLSATYSRD